MFAIIHWIKSQILELNLFENEATRNNNFHLRTAIISTRIYLLLLTLTVTILTIFISSTGQLINITVQNPSQMIYEDLYNKYPTTLQCFCKQIAVSYGSFLSISAEYHPVCSSSFVSNEWINILYNPNITFFYPIDFRSSANGQFQLLTSLCSLIIRSVNDAIDDFLSDTFLTTQVVSQQLFGEQNQAQSSFLKSSTADSVQRLLHHIRDATSTNRLQTALMTSTAYNLQINPPHAVSVGVVNAIYLISTYSCYCQTAASCVLPSTFYTPAFYYVLNWDHYQRDNAPLGNVTGFVAGCYAIESLFQSTLECFFHSICLDQVLTFFPVPINNSYHALDDRQTRFQPQTSIETLVSELFIENWTTVSSFSLYYAKCAPTSCIYAFTQHNNVLYLITKLLSLYGGLTIVLRIIVPFVISKWRNRNVRRVTLAPTNFGECRHAIWMWIRIQIIELNLFKNAASRNDSYELVTSRISTRIFLLLLILSTLTLTIYTASRVQVQSATVENPSETVYKNLQENYQSTINCPCSQLIIPYGTFISFSPQYHPVCLSLYISDDWILSTRGPTRGSFDANNFLESGQYYFRALATFCSLAQTTLSDAWQVFNKSVLVTSQVLPFEELIARTRTVLNQFEVQTVTEFKRTIALIAAHTESMFLAYTNVDFLNFQIANISKRIDIPTSPHILNNCSCALSAECKNPVGLYSYSSKQLIFNIPNFFVGCSVLHGVRQSSLECFFDQSCLDAVQWQIISIDSLDISILDANATRFPPETLIGDLLDGLMLEQWGESIQYDQYYSQCAPKLCSYTYISHDNALYVFTTIMGLFGGLVAVLKIVVPIVVSFIRNKLRQPIAQNDTAQLERSLTLKDRMHSVWHQIKTKMATLNVFDNEATWDDERRIQTEITATCLYILLLTVSCVILIIYTYFTPQIQTIIIDEPSQTRFEQLQSNPQHSNTLVCPCENISESMEFGHKEFGHLNFDHVQILLESGNMSKFY